MGIYINPGNEGFATIRNGLYVDKSGLVACVNRVVDTPDKLVCVSRPRRFGKSFAAQMLVAYYDAMCDSHALFDDLAVAQTPGYERHLNAYHVVLLGITDIIDQVGDHARVVPEIRTRLVRELNELFPGVSSESTLENILVDVAGATGRKFVFVIDEWDALFREAVDDEGVQRDYISLLRGLFKSATVTSGAIAAAYMTGILPIKKYGSHSAISDFREFTMMNPAEYAPYVGFAEDEVRELCRVHGMGFEDMRRWYDGYELPGVGAVYAPNSVMEAVKRRMFASYWGDSESHTALLRYIDRDFDGLQRTVARLVAGERTAVSALRFQNDMASITSADDVLTLLVHLGYLAYDAQTGTVRIPSEEVRLEFAATIRGGSHPVLAQMVRDADRLYKERGGTRASIEGIR